MARSGRGASEAAAGVRLEGLEQLGGLAGGMTGAVLVIVSGGWPLLAVT